MVPLGGVIYIEKAVIVGSRPHLVIFLCRAFMHQSTRHFPKGYRLAICFLSSFYWLCVIGVSVGLIVLFEIRSEIIRVLMDRIHMGSHTNNKVIHGLIFTLFSL